MILFGFNISAQNHFQTNWTGNGLNHKNFNITFGCYSDKTEEVMIDSVPKLLCKALSLEGNVSACEGDTVKLIASGRFDKYFWNTGDITHNIQITMNGSYRVKVVIGYCEDFAESGKVSVKVGYNGCIGSDTIGVQVEESSITEDIMLDRLINFYPNPTNVDFTIDNQTITKSIVIK